MEFLSSVVLLFLSPFVLCALCSILNVYGAINDLIGVFFSSLSLKKYISLCIVSIYDLSENLTHAPGELRFISRL